MSFASIFRTSTRLAAAIAICAFACIAAASRASAEPCPKTLFLESANGRYYVAVFGAPVSLKSSIGITLYSKTNAYSASLSSVSIEKPWKSDGIDGGFRSFAALLANPGTDPLLAAVVRPFDLKDGTLCSSEEWIVPSVAAVAERTKRHTDIGALEAEVTAEAGDGSNAFSLAPIPTPAALACAVPFAAQAVAKLVEPDFVAPAGAAPLGTVVRIELGDTGSVRNVAILKASTDAAFDRAALVAARSSTFTPRVFACNVEPSSYLLVEHPQSAPAPAPGN